MVTQLDSRQAPTQHVVVLQALHVTPQRVAEVLSRLPAAAHDWQARPDTWSARMLAAHLAGGEAPFLKRLRTMVAEANPYLPHFGPDVARSDAPGTSVELLEQFRDERLTLVRMLVELKPSDWERPAVHETMGPTTLSLQVQNIANHDADHFEQLVEVAEAWEQRRHA